RGTSASRSMARRWATAVPSTTCSGAGAPATRSRCGSFAAGRCRPSGWRPGTSRSSSRRGPVRATMPLGDFLVAYLQKIGVTHLFGIPGDLVIRLFFRFGRRRAFRIVTLSHEPGVGFAADGYARATGRLAVVCVTYGAGGHNMVNAVAGSFSERVPVLVISGGPGGEGRRLGMLIHHQAKEDESDVRIPRELTWAAPGGLAAGCVACGAGGHNMVNAVAGSFSERVPVLGISGGPGEEERRLGMLIHHQAKEIESQLRIYRELTCAARVLDDPHTAAESVHDVVRTVRREQQPGYLEIHRDMVERRIPVPRAIIDWDGALAFRRSDERKVEEAVRETAARFNASRRPLTMVGLETL